MCKKTDTLKIWLNFDVCVCVHSCESSSCGRRDVASCCCGGTCNTWFVLSVKRNMRGKKHNSYPFFVFTVSLLNSPPDAQQTALAQQQQTIVNQQAIIMVNPPSGFTSVYLLLCSFFGINMSSFVFSGPADDHAGHGHRQQPRDKSPHLPNHKSSHEPTAPPPSQPVCTH